jgi:hypothetical protein
MVSLLPIQWGLRRDGEPMKTNFIENECLISLNILYLHGLQELILFIPIFHQNIALSWSKSVTKCLDFLACHVFLACKTCPTGQRNCWIEYFEHRLATRNTSVRISFK